MGKGPPPLPHRKPPRLPRRPAELGLAVGKEEDITPRGSPAACSLHDEESCLDLAKLMLSPEGLAMKKIALERFTIPVVLRLLDRRRPPQQGQQRHTGEAALSITWVHQDTFGFDIRGLKVRRDEAEAEDDRDGDGVGRAAAGRKRSRGVGSGDCCCAPGKEAHLLVLSWSIGGGSAEVVLEAASRQQRDLLAVTLETLVCGLGRGSNAGGVSAASGDGAAGVRDDGELPRDRAASCSSAVLEPPPDADTYDNSSDDEEAAALMLAEFDKAEAVAASAAAADTGSRRTTLAGHETDVTAARADGGGLLFSPANGITSARDAAVTLNHVHHETAEQCSGSGSRAAAAGLHRRGMSFSPGRSAGVPVLARARTTGAVAGRESEAAQQQQEEEQHARVRRKDAMTRLLAVYDRARDESQAAAWRLGAMKLKRLLSGVAMRQVEGCWAKWCGVVRRANDERQKADRRRWFLHAKANQNNDLLAWYHATFCREVYRRRVPFWFRETQLKPYQKAYRIVDDDGDAKYTPMEKSLMASCVCTVGTKYADVAAQLFTAKGVLSVEEYRVFQTLVKRGAEVPKANPKSGKRFPHPMKLRLWFNRGALCLTAKRDKPDGTASKDHSFYLSKVKTCVIALPSSSRRGSRSSNSDGAPTPTSGGGNGGGDAAGFGALAPSPADVSNADRIVGRRGLASSSAAAAAAVVLSSPLPPPSAPHHLSDSASGSAQGFAHDEADRGAGGRSAAAGNGGDGGSSAGAKECSRSGRSTMPPPAAVSSSTGRLADTTAAGAGWVGGGPSSPGSRHRMLSIHFFGRTMTLDLWFASETEAVEWQGMLTKLSWKEQGYLYRGPPGDAGGGEEDIKAEEEQEVNLDRIKANEVASGGELGGDSGDNGGRGRGGGSGGSMGENEAATISPVVVSAPSPSSSSSSPSIVTSEWAHATHGGSPPPLPPPPLQPAPPCVR